VTLTGPSEADSKIIPALEDGERPWAGSSFWVSLGADLLYWPLLQAESRQEVGLGDVLLGVRTASIAQTRHERVAGYYSLPAPNL
jgi:hypothetical protein